MWRKMELSVRLYSSSVVLVARKESALPTGSEAGRIREPAEHSMVAKWEICHSRYIISCQIVSAQQRNACWRQPRTRYIYKFNSLTKCTLCLVVHSRYQRFEGKSHFHLQGLSTPKCSYPRTKLHCVITQKIKMWIYGKCFNIPGILVM
jgi:hypothetical protein